jgi:hypothetical protein
MNEQLRIELPGELKQQLVDDANRFNVSLENWVLRLLTKAYHPVNFVEEEDPILPLLGTLKAETNDIGEHHDFYLSQIWSAEVNLAKE